MVLGTINVVLEGQSGRQETGVMEEDDADKVTPLCRCPFAAVPDRRVETSAIHLSILIGIQKMKLLRTKITRHHQMAH